MQEFEGKSLDLLTTLLDNTVKATYISDHRLDEGDPKHRNAEPLSGKYLSTSDIAGLSLFAWAWFWGIGDGGRRSGRIETERARWGSGRMLHSWGL
jgi:hypothetical protein